MSNQTTEVLSESLDGQRTYDPEVGSHATESASSNQGHAVSFDLPDFGNLVDDHRQIRTTQVDHVQVTMELGRVTLDADEFASLKEGDVVPLDCRDDDPIDIFADGKLIARGELVVMENRLGVRIVEKLPSDGA